MMRLPSAFGCRSLSLCLAEGGSSLMNLSASTALMPRARALEMIWSWFVFVSSGVTPKRRTFNSACPQDEDARRGVDGAIEPSQCSGARVAADASVGDGDVDPLCVQHRLELRRERLIRRHAPTLHVAGAEAHHLGCLCSPGREHR